MASVACHVKPPVVVVIAMNPTRQPSQLRRDFKDPHSFKLISARTDPVNKYPAAIAPAADQWPVIEPETAANLSPPPLPWPRWAGSTKALIFSGLLHPSRSLASITIRTRALAQGRSPRTACSIDGDPWTNLPTTEPPRSANGSCAWA